MDKNNHIALAVDIGGSKLVVGLVDKGGKVLCKTKHAWAGHTKEQMLADITAAADALLKAHREYVPTTGGATIPGLADPEKGIWVEASFSGISNWPIAAILEEKFGVPFFIDNDTNACAIAEKHYGACKDCGDFFWITVSNGVGGAVFMNNNIYYGASGNAGEVGHVVVEENEGNLCKCGSYGCLEMHAAGPAIAKKYLQLGGQELIDQESPTALSIAKLAKQNDKIAIDTYNIVGRYLGKAVGGLVNVLNPRKVVIGGGVSNDFELFEKALTQEAERRFYKNANKNIQILKTELGYDAALIGAAALAFRGKNII